MPVDDSYTKVLLHMDGVDGSTTFTDESGKTWTANGNAQIDTAQKKFGTASLLLDGTGDYIDTPDHADFDVGSGNFTVDLWVRRNANGFQRITGQMDSASNISTISWYLQFDPSNHLQGGIYSGSTEYGATSTGTVTADSTWHHTALVRNGNTITLYIDGTADGTVGVTGITANNSAYRAALGSLGEETAAFKFNGWIDEFRFSKGIARWTGNFTPPTGPYGDDMSTKFALLNGIYQPLMISGG